MPESHLSILATAAEGEDDTKTVVSMEEDSSCSTFGIREEITTSSDLPPQLLSPPPVADVVIDDPSTRSLGSEHIEHHYLDAIVLENSAVSHTPSSNVEVLSSPTLGLLIGMLFPLNSAVALSEHSFLSPESHSQMPALAASGSSRSYPSAAVEGEETVKATLCQEKGKDDPQDDNTLTSDILTRRLPPQAFIDVSIAGVSRTHSRSSLDS